MGNTDPLVSAACALFPKARTVDDLQKSFAEEAKTNDLEAFRKVNLLIDEVWADDFASSSEQATLRTLCKLSPKLTNHIEEAFRSPPVRRGSAGAPPKELVENPPWVTKLIEKQTSEAMAYLDGKHNQWLREDPKAAKPFACFFPPPGRMFPPFFEVAEGVAKNLAANGYQVAVRFHSAGDPHDPNEKAYWLEITAGPGTGAK
jgi:hypothetical protein